MRFPLLLLALLLSVRAPAQSLPARAIRLDVNQVQGPLGRGFNFCVGAGRANEGLRADWQQQLVLAQRECGFRYLRLHGLLHDDMGVYGEDRAGHPVYNWQYIDKLYDFLLSIQVKPFVELSFMPNALRSTDQTIFWWKANVSPPKDYAKWEALVTALVRHWEERYGRAEVASWYFEVWNEPNYPAFFAGTQAEYFKLYAATARAVKAVSASYRVGGPASSGTGWIGETLAYCAQNKVPLDFVSTHDYGVGEGGLDEFGQGQQKLGNPNGIARHVAEVQAKIRASAFPNAELHITEWSTSYSPRDPVHDAYQSAAYILNTLKQTEKAATSMSYWTFSDIFEEAGVPPAPFHGGFGLLNLQGVRKPAYFAYRYLHQLGPTELRNADPASWATTDAAGNVQVLCWNFSAPALGPEADQQYFVRPQPAAAGAPVRLAWRHLPPGTYALTEDRTGYERRDAYTAYLKMGRPAQLSRAQETQLRAAAQAAPGAPRTLRVGPGGNLAYTLDLRKNDVVLLLLNRLR
ncbi:MAG: GH39 family glycosyl hydrolase [Janthinobacterium lividum]